MADLPASDQPSEQLDADQLVAGVLYDAHHWGGSSVRGVFREIDPRNHQVVFGLTRDSTLTIGLPIGIVHHFTIVDSDDPELADDSLGIPTPAPDAPTRRSAREVFGADGE